MNNLLEWIAKFFGHIPVAGIEALLVKGLQAVLVLLVAYLALRITFKTIEHHFRKSDKRNDAAIKTYKRISRYVFWPLGILLALHVAGINLSSVFTTSGLFAVAIGFALKDITGNYIGGLIIKANNSIKPGDVLNIDDQMVRVKVIGLRDTIVRTKDLLDILIPNSILVQGKIGNYTLRDSVCRVMTTVGVSYSSDQDKVRAVLEKACSDLHGLSAKYPPVVTLDNFGNSSVNYHVNIYIGDPWARRLMRSKLNEAVWGGLKEAGIEISFPQLDVHLDRTSE